MISVQYCSQIGPQDLGFFHYPYITCRIKSETWANKISHFQKCLNTAEELYSMPWGHCFLSWFSETASNSFPSRFLFLLSILHMAARKHITPPSQPKPFNLWFFKLYNPFYRLQRAHWRTLATSLTSSPTTIPHSFLSVALGCLKCLWHTGFVPSAAPLTGWFFLR